MMTLSPQDIKKFRRRVFSHFQRHKRNLPFRNTRDPYKITISEIMLQQTQVDRVVPFYLHWVKKFPNWKALSRASNQALLSAWSGLGYNRRALNLGRLAKTVVGQYNGILPKKEEELLALPGIGPYTANAILIFAFNSPRITIDTNIRRVLIYELRLSPSISLNNLKKIAAQVLPKTKSRDWHNALMDYGALALPKRTPSIPPLSKQSRFEGSIRQIRGEIIRQLTRNKKVTANHIAQSTRRTKKDVLRAIKSLAKDRLIFYSGRSVELL